MNEFGEYMDSVGTVRTVTSGGVIRFSESTPTPTIHANSAHLCVGIRKVFVNSDGHLEISHEAPGPVVTSWCIADETLSRTDLRFGMSGGVGRTVVNIWAMSEKRLLNLLSTADWNRVRGAYANLWVGWVHAVQRNAS